MVKNVTHQPPNIAGKSSFSDFEEFLWNFPLKFLKIVKKWFSGVELQLNSTKATFTDWLFRKPAPEIVFMTFNDDCLKKILIFVKKIQQMCKLAKQFFCHGFVGGCV